MKFNRRNYIEEAKELNITAFLNLMVILVPFLLITAVFSRLTVLELNLPMLDAASKSSETIELQLQLVVGEKDFVIQDVNIGEIRRFSRDSVMESNWKAFDEILLEIKRRFPEEDRITLLFEKTVPYKMLIQVMDHVRSTQVVNIDQVQTVELFPNVSIGDAEPVVTDAEKQMTLEKVNDDRANDLKNGVSP
ncbi:biopolymer transporter ExbD [Aliikangiella sp. G2MR2-5]|uniref:ExbD/TolR family protein n=1 Tax=Aliikangiella sp. G2MR2-5 TaxID=2788943 RepID=UPI0018A93212|nr:biopolymer transporter ExbD [Aliikangiella sp. G2MR2-5]